MSGHSKWKTIKHKKAATDAKRGKVFTKLIKEITVAARIGGGIPENNPRLRQAMQTAKENSMPMSNVERAIQKGTGQVEGAQYEEVIYEGYGPGGAAVIVESLTDNKNRTVAEVRSVFTRYNGNLGSGGSVSWLFQKKGTIAVKKEKISEEKLMEIALEAGADDIVTEEDTFEVRTSVSSFEKVRDILKEKNIPLEMAEVTMVPQNTVNLAGKVAESMLKLMEALEDLDDIQKVYSNFDIDEKELAQLAG